MFSVLEQGLVRTAPCAWHSLSLGHQRHGWPDQLLWFAHETQSRFESHLTIRIEKRLLLPKSQASLTEIRQSKRTHNRNTEEAILKLRSCLFTSILWWGNWNWNASRKLIKTTYVTLLFLPSYQDALGRPSRTMWQWHAAGFRKIEKRITLEFRY